MNEKYRHEFKYLCTEGQLAILEARLKGIMKKDIHAGKEGKYYISSMYFDDVDDRCFWENEDGNGPREKYRIRIYNNSIERIMLECKRKDHDMVSKSSCLLTKGQFLYLVYGEGEYSLEQAPFLMKRLMVLKKNHGMQPKVIVSYERTPYVCRLGNVRITFDRNISSSYQMKLFGNPQIGKRQILPTGMQLLEVKYDEYIPDHLYRALSLANMQRTTFSKYYLCRKYGII